MPQRLSIPRGTYPGKSLVPPPRPSIRGARRPDETNGSYPFGLASIPEYDHPCSWVVDYKCPSSGMSGEMPSIESLISQIHRARKHRDEVWIKWVIADERDLAFALERIGGMANLVTVPHLISPIDGKGEMIQSLVDTIRRSDPGLVDKIIFSVQLHKLIKMP